MSTSLVRNKLSVPSRLHPRIPSQRFGRTKIKSILDVLLVEVECLCIVHSILAESWILELSERGPCTSWIDSGTETYRTEIMIGALNSGGGERNCRWWLWLILVLEPSARIGLEKVEIICGTANSGEFEKKSSSYWILIALASVTCVTDFGINFKLRQHEPNNLNVTTIYHNEK